MQILAKAKLNGLNTPLDPSKARGAFVAWDTSTDAFYFRRWTGDPVEPLFDRNQWFAARYEAQRELEEDANALIAFDIYVFPFGDLTILDLTPGR